MPELFKGLRDFEAKLRGDPLPSEVKATMVTEAYEETEFGDRVPMDLLNNASSTRNALIGMTEEGSNPSYSTREALAASFTWSRISEDFRQAGLRIRRNQDTTEDRIRAIAVLRVLVRRADEREAEVRENTITIFDEVPSAPLPW